MLSHKNYNLNKSEHFNYILFRSFYLIMNLFYFLSMHFIFCLCSGFSCSLQWDLAKACLHITPISVKQLSRRFPQAFFLIHFPLLPTCFEFCLHNLDLFVLQHYVDVTIKLLLLFPLFLRFTQVFVHTDGLLTGISLC